MNNMQFSCIMTAKKKGLNRMAGWSVYYVTARPISRHPLINSSLAFTAAQPRSSAASLASISSGVKKLQALFEMPWIAH